MLRSLPAVGHPIGFYTICKALFTDNDKVIFLRNWETVSQIKYVSSGSAALILSIESLKLRSDRKEVILPAYTCPSVLAAVIKAGLEPILCDSKPNCFQMDLKQLESKIGPKTLAVIAVHLFGIPGDIISLKELTKKKGIFLIEDAAQAFENRVNGDLLGQFGDLSIFSFGRGKPFSLLSGGAVVVNNPELYEPVKHVYRSLKDTNRKIFLPKYLLSLFIYSIFYHPIMYWIPMSIPWLRIGETIFSLNFDITKIDPKVVNLGKILYEKFKEIRKIRINLTRIYNERLAQYNEEFEFLPEYDGDDIALLRFPIIFKRREKRDKIFSYLVRNRLGATGSYPAPLNELEGVPPYLKTKSFYPNAKAVSERILTLPLHEYVTESDIDNIVRIIGAC